MNELNVHILVMLIKEAYSSFLLNLQTTQHKTNEGHFYNGHFSLIQPPLYVK